MAPHCSKTFTVKGLVERARFHLLSSPLLLLFLCSPLPCLQPLPVCTLSRCWLLQQKLKLVFFSSSLRCVPLFPQRKRRGEKKAIYLLQTVTGLCNNTAFLSLF